MRYRKKPELVEASPVEFILAMTREGRNDLLPDWIQAAVRDRRITVWAESGSIVISTTAGNKRGVTGDFLVLDRGALRVWDSIRFEQAFEVAE